MRTSLIRTAIVVAGLALAVPAFAAFDDVTLTTDTVISAGGVALNVSGSSASIESIVVNANNFTVSLQSGSTLAVSSAGLNQISVAVTNSNVSVTTVCTASASSVTISTSVADTITVTPNAGTCPVTTSSSSSSGGNGPVASSGGGGGGGVAVYGATPTIPAQATQAGSPSQSAQTAKFAALQKALAKGSKGAGVKVLQQMLNADPDTQVSLSGAGSPGNETTLFGNATFAAIKKFQAKWGIVSSGTPATTGYGALGPKTRAKLNALFAQ